MTLSIKLLLVTLLATGCYGTVGYEGDVYGYNAYGDPIYYQDGSYRVLSNGYWYSQGPSGYVPYGHNRAYRSQHNNDNYRHQAYRQHNNYRQNTGHRSQHGTQDHRGYRR